MANVDRFGPSLTQFSLEPADSAGARWEKWLALLKNALVAANITTYARKKAQLLYVAGVRYF